jgi:DNA-binding NarL/FixJ family response regulator
MRAASVVSPGCRARCCSLSWRINAREREILGLLAEGGLYKEIAKTLGLSTSTVRVHLHSIYTKLHVQTRTQAVLKYLGR